MKPRVWLVRCACLAAAMVVAGGLLELGLRAFAPVPPSWLSIYSLHPRLPYSLQANAERQIDTGVTQWTVVTDDDRLRIGVAGPVPRAEPHWLAIGDSFAFGHGVDAEHGLIGRLEAETGVRIANAAIPGFGPTQYRAMLAEHLDREGLSGVLVVAYLGNDFHDALWDKSVAIHDGILGLKPGWRGVIKRRSHAYRFLTNALHRLGLGARSATPGLESDLMRPGRWTSFLDAAEPVWVEAYRGIRELGAARGIPVVVIVLPNRAAVDEDMFRRIVAARAVDAEALNPTLARVKAGEWIERAGLRVIDATDALLQVEDARFLPFDGHFTGAVNAALARSLAGPVSSALSRAN
jgi:hypothetical protein